MGKGIELARTVAPEHAALIDDMKDQLLLLLIKKLGAGKPLRIPIAEVDATGGDVMMMRVDFEARDFVFEIRKKQ